MEKIGHAEISLEQLTEALGLAEGHEIIGAFMAPNPESIVDRKLALIIKGPAMPKRAPGHPIAAVDIAQAKPQWALANDAVLGNAFRALLNVEDGQKMTVVLDDMKALAAREVLAGYIEPGDFGNKDKLMLFELMPEKATP